MPARLTSPRATPRGAGFTLIELILVMALLVIVIGVSFPSLQAFFRGRTMNSEVRRFLSLTRYGQSRAASEGVPMVLWIDVRERSYGLQAESGFLVNDGKAVAFPIDDELQIAVSAPPVTTLSSTAAGQHIRQATQSANLPSIRFTPEGFIGETSPEFVQFQDTRTGPESTLWVAQSSTRQTYEIRTSQPIAGRR